MSQTEHIVLPLSNSNKAVTLLNTLLRNDVLSNSFLSDAVNCTLGVSIISLFYLTTHFYPKYLIDDVLRACLKFIQ